MRYSAALLVLLPLWVSVDARAEMVAFSGRVDIRASVGTSPESFELLSVAVSGFAEIDAGAVRIQAGALSVPVPTLSGFGGNLANGPATLSPGGAGSGASCPLTSIQEICIAGGGFGGVMRLGGVTHLGQELVVWGQAGSHSGSTASGIDRVEDATRWTQGAAVAWYFIPEIDPTPFTLAGVGTFRGLPGTFMGTGPAGFSVVTPMVVTAGSASSANNARAIAEFTIDFEPEALPVGGSGALVLLLLLAGVARLTS